MLHLFCLIIQADTFHCGREGRRDVGGYMMTQWWSPAHPSGQGKLYKHLCRQYSKGEPVLCRGKGQKHGYIWLGLRTGSLFPWEKIKFFSFMLSVFYVWFYWKFAISKSVITLSSNFRLTCFGLTDLLRTTKMQMPRKISLPITFLTLKCWQYIKKQRHYS